MFHHHSISFLFITLLATSPIAFLVYLSLAKRQACHSGSCWLFGVVLFLQVALPSITSVFFFEPTPFMYQYQREGSWVIGLILSFLYWSVFSAVALATWGKPTRASEALCTLLPPNALLAVSIGLLPIAVLGKFAVPEEVWEAGYTSAAWVSSKGYLPTGLKSILQPFGFIFYPLLLLVSFVEVRKPEKSNLDRVLTCALLAVLAAGLAYDLLMGSRGAYLNVALLLLLGCWVLSGRRRALTLCALLSGAGLFISPIILIYRHNPDMYVGKSAFERILSIRKLFQPGTCDESLTDIVSDIVFRFDGEPNGGNLALYSLDNGHVYFQPYIGSALGVIPRAVWPGKPQPKSGDGTVYEIPQWLSGRISNRPYLCTSVSTAGVAFWHFGLIGLVLLPAAHAYLIRVAVSSGDHFLRKDIFLFLWFLCDPTRPIDTILLNVSQWIIPILLIVFCLNHVIAWPRNRLTVVREADARPVRA